jgi:FHA domain-containing protein
MQIRIDVVAMKGSAAAQPAGATFDASGGTIGRVETNKLVLDDPDRTVSRVHAQIVYRDNGFVLIDRGSNAVQWNGQLLGAGNEATLASGDKLFIGSFELSVKTVDANDPFSDSSDPFADLLDGLGPAKSAKPAAAVTPVPLASPVSHTPSKTIAPADAFSAFDPFDDLLDPMPVAQSKPAYVPNNQHLGSLSGVDDFSDIGLGPNSAGKSLDAMFGLEDVKPNADPFAFSASADLLMQPNTSGDSDPMRALSVVHKPSAAAVSDHIPALQHAYVPPPTRAEFVPVDPNTTISRMPKPKKDKPLEQLHAPVVPAVQAEGQPEAPSDALLEALLRGLQMTHQSPTALTPELMERMGSILRTSAEGTIQLLLTRQDFKRELRADVTMIASNHNNPLKFSPTPEVALAHLLGEQVRGFMAPRDAMRDAYQDLKAHQMGVMVGMKAALTHLLERFTPEALEEKIAAKSKFDTLFAANRKAKLWDQFCTLQKGITREAEDDFHNLFGKEFAKTYDEQMALMRQSDAKRANDGS